MPPKLPRSGPGDMGAIALTLLGLYTAVLHRRSNARG
jgi:hypothetical protein